MKKNILLLLTIGILICFLQTMVLAQQQRLGPAQAPPLTKSKKDLSEKIDRMKDLSKRKAQLVSGAEEEDEEGEEEEEYKGIPIEGKRLEEYEGIPIEGEVLYEGIPIEGKVLGEGDGEGQKDPFPISHNLPKGGGGKKPPKVHVITTGEDEGTIKTKPQKKYTAETDEDEGGGYTKPGKVHKVTTGDDGDIKTKPQRKYKAETDDGDIKTKPQRKYKAETDDGDIKTKPQRKYKAETDDGVIKTKPQRKYKGETEGDVTPEGSKKRKAKTDPEKKKDEGKKEKKGEEGESPITGTKVGVADKEPKSKDRTGDDEYPKDYPGDDGDPNDYPGDDGDPNDYPGDEGDPNDYRDPNQPPQRYPIQTPHARREHHGYREYKKERKPSYVVGIGTSAGGLKPVKEMVKHLSESLNISYVIVQHPDKNHETITPEKLSGITSMPIIEAEDEMEVEPNRIYIIPRGINMHISDRTLKVIPAEEIKGKDMPVDHFFTSLANEYEEQAIGVVLSGDTEDGAEGLKKITNEGGTAMIQDAKTAEYSKMPQSAIDVGVTSIVLPPKEIAGKLKNYRWYPGRVLRRRPDR